MAGLPAPWIPAYAGMTVSTPGMTVRDAGDGAGCRSGFSGVVVCIGSWGFGVVRHVYVLSSVLDSWMVLSICC